ncbi:MAG TPA: hypothetical protein VFW96_22475 [Thermomicrobiales bacterium]|nr:hypothetical protein [Thermomicrobiales bacterium]
MSAPDDAWDRLRFTIRYRCTTPEGQTGLVVVDAWGAAYLFSRGALHLRCEAPEGLSRLLALLRRRSTVAPAAAGATYNLAGLRRLHGGAA